MRITVYNCTQKSLIGYYIEIDYFGINKILDEKRGELCKEIEAEECIGYYTFNFDVIIRLSSRKFIFKNSNLSIWCKLSQNIPEFVFGDRSFVIRRRDN